MSIRSDNNERKVVLADIPDEQAKALLAGLTKTFEIGEGAIPKFTAVNYHSFKVEYATINSDIILHFFLPKHATADSPEVRQAWMGYWLKDFPAKLDPVAQAYFEAPYPRLMAKYTPEVASWWFRAQGFGDVLDVGAFLQGFFERLDAALNEKPQ